MKKIYCFGEVLWDVFPTHKKIGGAPLNVAVRLRSFGNEVAVISKIGEDEDGEGILNFLKEKEVSVAHIQRDASYKTGSVSVSLNDEGSASYTIDFPRAWDYIDAKATLVDTIQDSDAFIFGSLAARNEHTKSSLLKLLEQSKFRVFDVNLRAPHYTPELLEELMMVSDFIKFNDEEVVEIAEYMGSEFKGIEENMKYISAKTNTSKICVTRGGDGAILLFDGVFYEHQGYPAKVVNTVGAGDSFLATLIHYILEGKSPDEAIDYACAVGSLVAESAGANPELSMEEIDRLKK